ncbi:MAG TPA: hypothetical protein VMH27_09565 [Puia sp.]|nr:hypothetical protein [Puia sp.]
MNRRQSFWPLAAFSLVLILLSNVTSGQRWYTKLTDSLTKVGIDTIVWYQPWTSPIGMEATDSVIVYERQYLLWKSKENLYVSQFYYYTSTYNEKHGDSVKQLILRDTFNLFGYLHDHFQAVISDTLLYAKLRTVKAGKEEILELSPGNVRDDGYTGISVLVAGKAHSNGYRGEQLNDGIVRNPDGSFREKQESLNYETNCKTAIHQFIMKIEKEVTAFGQF